MGVTWCWNPHRAALLPATSGTSEKIIKDEGGEGTAPLTTMQGGRGILRLLKRSTSPHQLPQQIARIQAQIQRCKKISTSMIRHRE